MKSALQTIARASLALAVIVSMLNTAVAQDATPAKELFGAVKLPAVTPPQAAGFYSKGCVSGAIAIPVDGPAWQVMRLSRNRRWGHPDLIKVVEKLAVDGQKVGWSGLLVGDISQPRGGPMLTGHASHQIGLDADIWLTPMPNRRLTEDEREKLSATSMLKGDGLYVDPDIWTPGQAAILKTAASYPQVER
ncbi:MAG: penicillin-insensitive murein endopeptidase, partial [Rhizobiaceae bacterium]